MKHLPVALAAAATLLAGCASMNSVTSEIASFGEWPANRAPGTYAIERLPSQQQSPRVAQQASLEASARQALEQVGFKPADAAHADVVVQIGARVTRYDTYDPWDDPMWWRWGPAYWRRPGYYWRPGWGFPPAYDSTYESEVGLLIRDRKNGNPLYEARATSSSRIGYDSSALGAMYQAALKDFPNAVPQPHRVSISLAPEKQASSK
jgi:predicted small secreted protein